MNGAKKFHKPESPAFNEGEVWVSSCGVKAIIKRIDRYGVDKWDVDVYYHYMFNDVNKMEVHKNVWAFQVRYQHQADLEI